MIEQQLRVLLWFSLMLLLLTFFVEWKAKAIDADGLSGSLSLNRSHTAQNSLRFCGWLVEFVYAWKNEKNEKIVREEERNWKTHSSVSRLNLLVLKKKNERFE